MTAFILSALWKPIAAFIGLLAVFWAGGRNARLKAELKEAREYAKTMERMNEVAGDITPADAREFLHKRGQQ